MYVQEELERNQSGTAEDRFVKEEAPDAEGESEVTYGLQMRAAPAEGKKSEKVGFRVLENA